jgi:hypothetical protein
MRTFFWLALGCLSCCVAACERRRSPLVTYPGAAPVSAPPKPVPATPRLPREAPPREPQADEARTKAIRLAAEGIRRECPGGDWAKWQTDTQVYRQALTARLAALPGGHRLPKVADADLAAFTARFVALDPLDDFPLVEIRANDHLSYLQDPAKWERAFPSRGIVAVSRWLRQQGIDLVFVVVPPMAEVYSEHFFKPCPADGIVAPHVRRSLFELLESGVEVVDGFALLRPVRQPNPDYLYPADDSNFGARGKHMLARDVATRLQRYAFANKAKGPNVAPVARIDSSFEIRAGDGDGADVFTPNQRERVRRAPPMRARQITKADGAPVSDEPESPLMIIGSCFVYGFHEELVAESNVLARCNWNHGQTTEAFGDFLAQPELLDGVRVVVWVLSEFQLDSCKPVPDPIMAALE